VRKAEQAHDEKVSVLRERCQRLHTALVESREFLELFRRVTSAESLRSIGKERQDLFGAYPESDGPSLLAEYVVNNTGELPSYYTTSPLWNRHREAFLDLLNSEEIRGHWEAALKTGEELVKAAQRLTRLLQEIRLELSLTHDVPYVTRSAQAGT